MSDLTVPLPMLASRAGVPGPRELVVFHDVIAADTGPWGRLVDDVARVLGLEPNYTPLDMRRARWVDRLLGASAAAPGPALVLPRPEADAAESTVGGATRRLVRVVIASGDAPDVVRSAGFLSRHLRRGGVHTTVLVVLSNGALPPMWEGPGHHAAAWRSELSRRHEGADRLRVLHHVPELGPAIHRQARDSDVVVLIWRRVAAEGRALVVRSVLGESDGLPCLLVPIDWVESLHSASRPTPAQGAMAPR